MGSSRRVISLLPAGTDIVAALGAAERLVGVTHECDWPPEIADRPRVTASGIGLSHDAAPGDVNAEVRDRSAAGEAMFRLDDARIAELRPTLFVTQAVCAVCAVSETDVRSLAARLDPLPEIVTLSANTFEGVLQDILRVAAALDRASEGRRLVAGIRARVTALRDALAGAGAIPRRVAVIEWTDPPYAAGHWVPEMVEMAGGEDVLAAPGEHSVAREMDAIHRAAPEVILFAPCGYSLERAAEEARQTLARDEWAWARKRECWAIDGNSLTSRPGPRLIDGIEEIARILHPHVFPGPRTTSGLSPLAQPLTPDP